MNEEFEVICKGTDKPRLSVQTSVDRVKIK